MDGSLGFKESQQVKVTRNAARIRIGGGPSISSFDDISAVTFEQRYEFRFLICRALEVIKGVGSVPEAGFPFRGGDPESAVRRFHVPSHVNARASSKLAHLADQKLSPAPCGIKAAAASKTGKHGISPETAEELINNCRNGIVAAKPFVKCFPGFQWCCLHQIAPFCCT